MEHDGKSTSILPLSVLILAFGLGGIYLYDQPYSSFRPENESTEARLGSIEDVDARLWEDPFQAVARASTPSPCVDWRFGAGVAPEAESSRAPVDHRAHFAFQESAGRQIVQLAHETRRRAEARREGDPPVVLLPVLVPGGPYFEQSETRRRARYAVLAALAAAGYVPESSERLGLVDTCWSFAGRLDPTSGRPVPMPYEWLVPDSLRFTEPGASAVLVLWLDESEFGSNPWVRIDDLLTHVVGYCDPSPWGPRCLDGAEAGELFAFRLIGPTSSDALARMATARWQPRRRSYEFKPGSAAGGPEEQPAADNENGLLPKPPSVGSDGPSPYVSFLAMLDLYLDDPDGLLGPQPLGEKGTSDEPLPLAGVLEGQVDRLAQVIEESADRTADELRRAAREASRPLHQALERHRSGVIDSDADWPRTVTDLWTDFQIERAAEAKEVEPLREVVKPAERLCKELMTAAAGGTPGPKQKTGDDDRSEGEVSSDAKGDDCGTRIVTMEDLDGRCSQAEGPADRIACHLLRHQLKPERAASLSEQAGHLTASLVAMLRALPERKALDLSKERIPEIVALWAIRHQFEVLGQVKPGSRPVVPDLAVYNYRATAPASLLMRSVEGTAVLENPRVSWSRRLEDRLAAGAGALRPAGTPSRGHRGGFQFVPVVRPDDHLAPELVEELDRRDLDLCDPDGVHHLALIGEWDTFYGRALPLTLEAAVVLCRDEWREREAEAEGHSYRRRYESLDEALLALVDGAADPPDRVERYHYLRGLDGVAPPTASEREERLREGPGGSGSSPPNEGFSSWMPWSVHRLLERPRGNPQFDYMRRLASQLRRHQEEIRDRGGELRAIGVVGTDTYDKLLVLQALRKPFSRTLFFTTDLDARMLHPADHDWTHNLIIASSYGLRLHPDLQPHTPPFRDNYQVAAFLAVRLALEGNRPVESESRTVRLPPAVIEYRPASLLRKSEAVEAEIQVAEILRGLHRELEEETMAPPPRLFEVARNGARYDLSPHGEGGRGVGSGSSQVHPRVESTAPRQRTVVLLLGILATGFVLLIPLVPPVRRFTLGRWAETEDRERLALDLFLGFALFVAFAFAWLFYRSVSDPGGEPFALWSGVSIWPTEAIRLAAALLAVFLLGFGIIRLEANAREIARRYGLPAGARDGEPGCWRLWRQKRREVDETSKGRGWLRGFRAVHPLGLGSLLRHTLSWPRSERSIWWREMNAVSVNAWRCAAGGGHRKGGSDAAAEALPVDGIEIWESYRYLGRIGHRFTRIVPVAVLYLVLGRLLIHLFGEPIVPHRGVIALLADRGVLIAGVGLTILLTFFVVDATRLCERFIEALAERPTVWSHPVARRMAKQRRVPQREVGDVIDLELIADRTEAVGNLILYPFVVLFLMIVSRSSFFDNWDWPFGLILVLTLSSAYALMCAVILRRAAEHARAKTIDHLRSNLRQAIADERGENGPRSAQIRTLIEDARSLRRGAFSHWTHHPLVKAILLPFSGVGVLALVELLSVMGR